MKRTRRVEVVRYSRQVSERHESSPWDIDELFAMARLHEFTSEGNDSATLPEPIPVRQPQRTFRSRARKLLKKFKP